MHVLIAIPDGEMRAALLRILHHSNWSLTTVNSSDEASVAIAKSGAVPVVVCQRRAGAWENVLRSAQRQVPQPRVVVTDRFVDEAMWAEVLNLGGYDLLPQPFDRKEVFRTLSSAWRSWHEEAQRSAAAVA